MGEGKLEEGGLGEMEQEQQQQQQLQLELMEDFQVLMGQQQVSEEQDRVWFWDETDAGVKVPGGAETGNVKIWAEAAGGCTALVCRAAWQRWPEA